MTLASRNSRRIVVDGVAFRWNVRRRPTYHRANGWSPLAFVVERAVAPAAVLIVSLRYAHPRNWLGLPSRAVTPGLVAEGISRAMTAGWKPDQPGPPFELTLTDRPDHPEHDDPPAPI